MKQYVPLRPLFCGGASFVFKGLKVLFVIALQPIVEQRALYPEMLTGQACVSYSIINDK